MLFNLANPFDLDRYKEYVNRLYTKHAVVEVVEKHPRRSLRQNSYLHFVLQYFASQYGCTVDEAKLLYFKREVNRELFVVKKTNRYGVALESVRSTADLSTAELTLAIDRFRSWASQLPMYIPSPEDSEEMIVYAMQEIERNKAYM